MHSVELVNGVPAFLIKLWKLVEDPQYAELICWSPNGLSFIIHDQAKFARDLLPLYFKHNNMASFIRQLNMYGFRKVMNIEQGRPKGGEPDDVEFYHQYFVQGKMNLLEFIKRKVPSSRTSITISTSATNGVKENQNDRVQMPSDSVQDIMSTISSIKSKQEGVDSQLNSMKQENEALWREVAYLRQKHIKQQQVVDKLIHFLVSLVQPKRNITVKRKMPLMLQDGSGSTDHGGKAPRLSRQFSKNNSVTICSSEGPVIHDVTDLVASPLQPVPSPSLEEEYVENVSPVVHILSPDSFVNSPLGTEEHMEPLSILEPLQNIEPLSPVDTSSAVCSEQKEETNNDSTEPVTQKDSLSEITNLEQVTVSENDRPQFSNSDETERSDMQVALSDNMQLSRNRELKYATPCFQRENLSTPWNSLNEHLDGMDSELAWLQEQLSNGTPFNLDTSALLGLFSSDDTVPGNTLPTEAVPFSGSGVTGNELMQYAPSFFDLELTEDELAPESQSTDKLQSLLQKTLHTPLLETGPELQSD